MIRLSPHTNAGRAAGRLPGSRQWSTRTRTVVALGVLDGAHRLVVEHGDDVTGLQCGPGCRAVGHDVDDGGTGDGEAVLGGCAQTSRCPWCASGRATSKPCS